MEIIEREKSTIIFESALEVHKQLGLGLLESAYVTCLQFELLQRGLYVQREVPLPLVYKDVKLDCGYRMDLVVENTIIIETKSVEAIHPVHHAQVITYMKLLGVRLGLLINFNVTLLKNGFKRIAL